LHYILFLPPSLPSFLFLCICYFFGHTLVWTQGLKSLVGPRGTSATLLAPSIALSTACSMCFPSPCTRILVCISFPSLFSQPTTCLAVMQ
jgi:hypothetical protein